MTTNTNYEERVEAIRGRMNELLVKNKISQNQVAGGDAKAQKRINAQLSHGSTLTVDTVLRVLDAFPDVSADVLLRNGEITQKKNAPEVHICRHSGAIAIAEKAFAAQKEPIKVHTKRDYVSSINTIVTHTQTDRVRRALGIMTEEQRKRLGKVVHTTTTTTRKKRGPQDFGGPVLP